jgi:hypothetical protein
MMLMGYQTFVIDNEMKVLVAQLDDLLLFKRSDIASLVPAGPSSESVKLSDYSIDGEPLYAIDFASEFIEYSCLLDHLLSGSSSSSGDAATEKFLRCLFKTIIPDALSNLSNKINIFIKLNDSDKC